MSLSTALSEQLGCKQQPVKATAVRYTRVQDPTSNLASSMPGLSAMLAGKVKDISRVIPVVKSKKTFNLFIFNLD